MDEYAKRPVIDHLWRMGRRFQDGFTAAATRLGDAVPAASAIPDIPRSSSTIARPRRSGLLMSLFLQETRRAASSSFRGFNISFSHGDA
jgi:hypothetical protein